MSNYFSKVPNFKYINLLESNKKNNKTEVKNLFRRAKLRPDIFQNLNYFERYFIKADERPDQIAFKLYKDSNLDWVILVTNNVLNVQSEWPMPQRIFNEYLLEKYGSYEEIYALRHYESKKVVNSRGETIFPEGLIVPERHFVEYYDIDLTVKVTVTDAKEPITNYAYEERLQEKKRLIYILKPAYLNIVLDDLNDIMRYKEGSTDYISRTLKESETLI